MSTAIAPRLIVALDYADPAAADALVHRLEPSLCRLKVGNELFTRAGPAWIEQWQARGFDVFLDLKYHDIPNTVAAACRAAVELGVWMVNVHALGGRRMLEAAREALDGSTGRPWLIGVTVLTSMEAADLRDVGLSEAPDRLAARLAALAAECGCDGAVCSAREAPMLRGERGREFVLVTPGIRPDPGVADDQRRTVTPADALRAGSDYLVVGRPVTGAGDPLAVLQALAAEIDDVPGM